MAIEQTKKCKICFKKFHIRPREGIKRFLKREFCSKSCASKFQGFQKGHKIFKGAFGLGSIHSLEARKKLSEINKGKKLSEQTKEKLRQLNLGKKLSEEHKKKMSEAKKGDKNPMKRIEVRMKTAKSLTGRKLTEETKRKIGLASKGNKYALGRPPENHWAWRGGRMKEYPISIQIRKSLKYRAWRKSVFERDNWICVICSKRGGKLEVDHIISFSSIIEKLKFEQGIDNLFEKAMNYNLLWDINNGRILCEDCHKLTDNYKIKALTKIYG